MAAVATPGRIARRRAGWLLALLLGLAAPAAIAAPALPLFSRAKPSDKPLLVQLRGDRPGLGQSDIGPGDPGVMLKYRTAFGVVHDPALEEDLNAILGRLQGAWPERPLPARVHVIPDSAFEARTYGKGGDIFVAVGMLESMESEDEIAALLGHEYSHVLLGHAQDSKLDQAAGGLFTGAMLFAMYRHDKKPDDTALMRQVGISVLAMETVSSGLVPAMTRKEEDQADRLGMDLMIRAGYNPVAMATMLERMSGWEARDASDAEARKARAASLDEAIRNESNGQVRLDLTPVVNAVFENIGEGIGKLMGRLRRQHADASERREHARDHLRTAHADAARPPLRPMPWAGQKHMQALFAGLAESREAWKMLSEERIDEARVRALIEKLRKTPAGKSAFPRFLAAFAAPLEPAEQMAREAAADDSLLRAHTAYLDMVGYRDHEAATAAYERAYAVFGDDPQLQPYAARFAPPKPGNPTLGVLCNNLKGDLKATCESLAKGSG